MNTSYYYHERIGMECQRLIDILNELNRDFDDIEIPEHIDDAVQVIRTFVHKAILNLRYVEVVGSNNKI